MKCKVWKWNIMKNAEQTIKFWILDAFLHISACHLKDNAEIKWAINNNLESFYRTPKYMQFALLASSFVSNFQNCWPTYIPRIITRNANGTWQLRIIRILSRITYITNPYRNANGYVTITHKGNLVGILEIWLQDFRRKHCMIPRREFPLGFL